MGVVYIGDISSFEHSSLRSELFAFTVASGSCAQVDAWVALSSGNNSYCYSPGVLYKEVRAELPLWTLISLQVRPGRWVLQGQAVSRVMVCNRLDPCQTRLFRRPEDLDGTTAWLCSNHAYPQTVVLHRQSWEVSGVGKVVDFQDPGHAAIVSSQLPRLVTMETPKRVPFPYF